MSSVCHTCGVREDDFSRRSCFDNHVKLHDNSSPSFCDNGIICKVCNKLYSSVYNLNKHMKNIHNITSEKKKPHRNT